MKQLYIVLLMLLTIVLPAQETHQYYNSDRKQIQSKGIRKLEVQDSSGNMLALIGYDAQGILRTCWSTEYGRGSDLRTFRICFDDTGLMRERYFFSFEEGDEPYYYYSISDTLPGKGMLIIELQDCNGGPGYCARMEVYEHDSLSMFIADSLPFPGIVARDTGQLSAGALRAMIHWREDLPKFPSYPISRINDLSLDGWPIVIAEDFRLDEILKRHYLFDPHDTRRFEKISFDKITGTMLFRQTHRADQVIWEEIDPLPLFPKCVSYRFTTEQQSNSNAGGNKVHHWRKKIIRYSAQKKNNVKQ